MELQEILHAGEGGLTNINEAEEEEEATREEEATKDGVTSQAESHAMLLLMVAGKKVGSCGYFFRIGGTTCLSSRCLSSISKVQGELFIAFQVSRRDEFGLFRLPSKPTNVW